MKQLIGIGAAAALIATGIATGVAAAEEPSPPVVGEVVKCRSEADDGKRLACYDKAAGALAKATSDGSIAVVSREDARKTRRSLFGFSVPKLPFFSGDKSAEDMPERIETSVKSARMLRDGNLTIVMEDGAVWRTTEPSRKIPKPGDKALIKSAALGSFFIIINGGRGLRAMRVG